MTQYDNEFFRGPPEGSPTLATDQRPTGAEIFQAKPEKATAAADVPVTREEAPKDPPKKKSNARRITKAIKLLASCMAAVVITEAATNIAATIEPPPEVPTGLYYEGQWPGVNPVHGGMYSMDMDADIGYSIQVPVADQVWRLTAPNNWRMCWYEGAYQVYMGMYDRDTDVFLMADLTPEPFYTDNEEDCYTTVTTSTGDTLYVRAFFLSLGKYGEEYGMEDYGLSEEMLAASAQLRQELVEEAFAGIRVTPGTEDGWQGFQIGDHLYSQQGPEWYGLGGHGDLDIHIPWVVYAEDYNLQNMTPYARETVNGITWSIYFAENDTYLWAVPNIDPEICLGGYVSRFMCADAQRRGEYISDDEWLEMGGFTSASQRQTAVDILIECLQHHYALRERRYPRDWPWKGPVDDHATLWIWAESVKGTWTQFSFGDEAYRVNSTDPELRFYWEETKPLRGDVIADLEISRMVNNEEVYAIGLTVCRTPFTYVAENCAYRTAQASGGETLYLEFRSQYHGDGADFTSAEMEPIADQILGSITFQSNPDDSGWCPLLLCDTMYSPANLEWSGCGIVGTNVAIDYIHTVESEGLNYESPIGTQTHNGITWTLYYDPGDEEWNETIWAVPDIEPDVCIGVHAIVAMEYYRQQYMEHPEYEGYENDELTAEAMSQAAEIMSEALSHIYPLGVEPAEDPIENPVEDPVENPTGDPVEDPMEGAAVWQGLLPADFDSNYGMSTWSNQNTEGIFALGGNVFVIESYREDLRFWWEFGQEDMAAVTIYSIPEQGDEQWSAMVWIQQTPFDTYEGDPSCYRTVNLPGNENLYLRFDGDEWMADEILRNTSFDYCGKEENWHTICIGNTLQTQQSYDWTGLGMVYQDYYFDYIHNGESVDLHDQDYEGQRTINGILWTFRFHKDNGVMYAYPETEPNLGIGANPDVLWNWYDGQYGALDDYFETLVESMSVGLRQYYLLPGVVIEREPVTGPVAVESEPLNAVQFSLGHRGYYLESSKEDAWLTWYFTEEHNGVMVADLTVGADCVAQVYITEEPLGAYDHLNHGMITVGTGDVLYWYCIELHSGDAAQLADFMGSLTASGERFASWGRVFIEDRIVTLQSLSWSGWETVETDGSRTVMMWNRERPADLELGTPIAHRKINKVVWTLYITEEYSSEKWPFIWAVPDVDPNIAIGSDYENAVYKYYEDHGMIEDFNGDIWSAESRDGAAEEIFEVLQNYYPT